MSRFALRLLAVVLFLSVSFSAVKASASSNALIGTDAQAFQEQLLDEGEFDLSKHLGKKVIMLDFWSIYCVSCVQEMPHLVKIYDKYKDNLLTVGVDLDSFGTKRVQQFVEKLNFKVTYPIVVDKRRKVAALYSVSVLPTTIIIDKKGKIIYYHVGYKPGDEAEIEETIKKAISAK